MTAQKKDKKCISERMKSFIPKEIRKYVEANVCNGDRTFDELMEDCAEERMAYRDGELWMDIDYDGIMEMSRILKDVIEKKRRLNRSITTDDYKSLIQDVKDGENGIGVHWSFGRGKTIEGDTSHKYAVTFVGYPKPESINYEDTYCKYQYERPTYHSTPDEEITLDVDQTINVLSARVTRQGNYQPLREYNWKDDPLEVTIDWK